MYLPCFGVRVGVRLISQVGSPGPWERRGLRLGLGMLVLTPRFGFYSKDPSVPQVGEYFFHVGPFVVGVRYGFKYPWLGYFTFFGGWPWWG